MVDVHLSWLSWFFFLILEEGLLVILMDCMIFLSLFLDVARISVNNFFPRLARLRNSLPMKCFPLTYDLNGLKSRITRHLLIVGSFSKQISCMLLSFHASFSCNFMPRSCYSALHGVNPNLKKKNQKGETPERQSFVVFSINFKDFTVEVY